MRQRALGAGAGGSVAQASLQSQNLFEPLHVAAGERERTELWPSLKTVPHIDSVWTPCIDSVWGPCIGPCIDSV